MKTFTFYNRKGGVGKTTLIILFAAYLRYYLGFKVKVMDFQMPESQVKFFRQLDLMNAGKGGSFLSNYLAKRGQQEAYPIETLGKSVNEYSAEDMRRAVIKVNEEIRRNEYDFLLLDFPAGYSKNTPISYLIQNRLLDGMYIPFSTDAQEYSDAFTLGRNFQAMHLPCRLLWYRVRDHYLKNKAADLDASDRGLAKYGLQVSNTRIRSFNKAAESSDVQCFVRNTLCWPDRYVKMVCPELIDLFNEILEFLDKV